ncbi:TIGR00645 family protein [Marinobacter salicampi]|uniref:TIGR00645 family protein n=1 Tax=Marinobacter salicampi TaxID=435907 RepID=UPI00140DB65C|nr:TIGR00645 family protein [Marinobacter salicampi]
MRSFEKTLEAGIFASRWLLAPFFVGLILAILVLLAKFMKELFELITNVWTAGAGEFDSVISILTLVDTALIASLLLIIVFSGYENFVSKIGVGVHEDRPAWMGKVGFADLKLKLIGAIVAISAVELLKAFLVSSQYTNEQLAWKVGIHFTFVLSGVFFAITDWISESRKRDH